MTAHLPDSPIRERVHDQFGRGRLAKSVAELIHHAPQGASMRIGIYGDWGEGKTSVLKLIEEELSSSGHICVWVAPWIGRTSEDIWAQLLTNVAERLNVGTKKYTSARLATEKVASVRDLASAHWTTKMIEGVLGENVKALMEKLAEAQRGHLVEAIDDRLSERKVVVFVDDLDRTNQSLVPQLLMSLRELFDFPNFYYVLALSPRVIESGLQDVGFGGEQPGRFLEKIVELPIHLPPLEDQAIARFIEAGIDTIGDFVDRDALRDIVPFMSRNPRRIKLFLRYLASLYGELKRYRADEMSWRRLYLAQMLRLEFPEATRRLAADEKVLDDLQFGVAERLRRLAGADEKREHDEVRYAPDHPEEKARFMALCAAIREEGSMLSGRYSMREMLELVERPPVFTLHEIDRFFDDFRNAGSHDSKVKVIESLIGKDSTGKLDVARAEAVLDASLLIRDSQLEQAAESQTREEMVEHLTNATPAAQLIEIQISELGLWEGHVLSATSWVKLYQHGLKWARFHHDQDYAQARSDERRLIRLAANRLPKNTQLGVLELRPFDPHHHVGGEAVRFTALAEQLQAEFTDSVVADLIHRFEIEDGLAQFWAIGDHTKGKWLLFDHASPFHKPANRRRLSAVARQARDNGVVHKNFLTYLRMLGYGASEGGSFSISECRALLRDATLLRPLWKAAVARPLNPRVAGTLRDYRGLLMKLGVREEDAPLPRWWRRMDRARPIPTADASETG